MTARDYLSTLKSTMGGFTANLPGGAGRDSRIWRQRHMLVLAGTSLYLPLIVAGTAVTGHSIDLASTYLMVVLLLGSLALSPKIDPLVRQTLATGALLTATISLVEVTDKGLLAHLGFAAALVLVSTYQSWLLQLFATTYVVFVYAVLGVLAPDLIFSSVMLANEPARWAAALCIGTVAASLPAIAAWSLNDTTAKDAAALSIALAEAAVRERQAVELNDTVMQDLVTALYANEAGDRELAVHATQRAVESARHIVDSLLTGDGVTRPLTRELPAQRQKGML